MLFIFLFPGDILPPIPQQDPLDLPLNNIEDQIFGFQFFLFEFHFFNYYPSSFLQSL